MLISRETSAEGHGLISISLNNKSIQNIKVWAKTNERKRPFDVLSNGWKAYCIKFENSKGIFFEIFMVFHIEYPNSGTRLFKRVFHYLL